MRMGTVAASAICAARYRRASATISKPFSVSGLTSKGERIPWVRMLSASSFKAASSKMRRGLVLDSLKSESETLRYSVALTTVVSMMRGSFRAVNGWKAQSLTPLPYNADAAAKIGITAKPLARASGSQLVDQISKYLCLRSRLI
jgi:hypothetical protein